MTATDGTMRQATWIEPAEAPGGPDAYRPAHHLAGEFEVPPGPIVAARLECSARGLFEAFLDGQRVGDRELTPGFTAYRSRIQVHTFDVTAILSEGRHVLGFLLSDGWFRGQHMVTRGSNRYGDTVAVIAELTVKLVSGDRFVFGTDGTWRSTPSHIRHADLVAGEVHDLPGRVHGWCDVGTSRAEWDAVLVADHPRDVLVPALGPAVRRTERIAARTVRAVSPERTIVDFGVNLNGWVRLGGLGPLGNRIVIEHGEALDVDGTSLDNTPHTNPDLVVKRDVEVPFQTDVVVSDGGDGWFEPRHSTKGFRYVSVDGHPGLSADLIEAVVVRSDLDRLGSFGCSDPDLTRLHEIAEWSFLTNACDIPTDCPTRERAGWTGDWQIFVATAAYLFDVTDFSRKWLLDLAADQLESGAVTQIVPNPVDFSLERAQWWKATQGPAGWGDAAAHVPWELHRSSGRVDVLEEAYPAMRRWVEYALAATASGRHPDRAARRPVAATHEEFIWDTGFHFGDWNEPGSVSLSAEEGVTVDHGATATAYLFRSTHELAQTAAVLGRSEDAQRFAELAEHVRDAWQREFVHDGRVEPSTQPHLVRALAFGLLPDSARGAAVDDLVGLVRSAGTHLGTGFLSTPYLLPILADNGRLDVAYELLFQRSRPSWLAMVDAGATTIWEDWESVGEDGRVASSLNHFSMGSVISFLHEYIAGLQPTSAGYRTFRVRPRPGGGVTSARTHHDSPHGRIEVSWIEQQPGTVELTVFVPPGTSASLVLGDSHEDVGPGRHVLTGRW